MKVLAAFTVSVQNDSECHVALVAELRTIHLAFENLSASSLASLSLNRAFRRGSDRKQANFVEACS